MAARLPAAVLFDIGAGGLRFRRTVGGDASHSFPPIEALLDVFDDECGSGPAESGPRVDA